MAVKSASHLLVNIHVRTLCVRECVRWDLVAKETKKKEKCMPGILFASAGPYFCTHVFILGVGVHRDRMHVLFFFLFLISDGRLTRLKCHRVLATLTSATAPAASVCAVFAACGSGNGEENDRPSEKEDYEDRSTRQVVVDGSGVARMKT